VKKKRVLFENYTKVQKKKNVETVIFYTISLTISYMYATAIIKKKKKSIYDITKYFFSFLLLILISFKIYFTIFQYLIDPISPPSSYR
jgi:prolipoprotein diacylglyceryltransferase